MSALVRRPFVVLILLVVANVTLLSVQIRNETGRTLLRSWSLSAFTPVAWAVHSLTGGTEKVFQQYVLLHGATRENRRLREENNALRLEVIRLRALERAFDRIPDYESVRSQFSFATRPAGVIWQSPPFHSQRLVVNVGSRHGVVKDAAVLIPKGIVGRVIAATPFTAEVELITNAGAAAGGLLPETGLEGVLRGHGTSKLTWQYIPSYEKAEVGQTVFTSGTDRIYPKGIPVGRITRSEKGTKVYREIQVEPLVDFLKLEEVLVVTRK